jgi:hypothetical protein
METSNSLTTTVEAELVEQARPYDLRTTDGCINTLVECFNGIQKMQRMSDEAMAAYLNIEGNTVQTLRLDLQEAGVKVAKQTLANRQSKLRKNGLLPEASGNAGRPVKTEDSVEEVEVITEPVISDEEEPPADEIASLQQALKKSKHFEHQAFLKRRMAEEHRDKLLAENCQLRNELEQWQLKCEAMEQAKAANQVKDAEALRARLRNTAN